VGVTMWKSIQLLHISTRKFHNVKNSSNCANAFMRVRDRTVTSFFAIGLNVGSDSNDSCYTLHCLIITFDPVTLSQCAC